MKDGANTTGNVTLTVHNSAMMASQTLNLSQFCQRRYWSCLSSYLLHPSFSPVTLSPGSYTLVLSSDAPRSKTRRTL
jgi:hypothetical protein